jgi:hypothetical protein
MIVTKSHYPYKYTATFDDGTRTNFGHQDYEDYTQHHDKERRRLYRERHEKDLRTGDPKRAGFLSYYLLWGDSTSLHKNIAAYKKRFNL